MQLLPIPEFRVPTYTYTLQQYFDDLTGGFIVNHDREPLRHFQTLSQQVDLR